MDASRQHSRIVLPKAPVKNRARRRRGSYDEEMEVEPTPKMGALDDDGVEWDIAPSSSRSLLDELGVGKLQDSTDSDYNSASDNSGVSAGNVSGLLAAVACEDPAFVYDFPLQALRLDAADTVTSRLRPLGVQDIAPASHTASVVSGTDLINRLSDEILLQVFKWLPKTVLVKCARVCKRWNITAFDETLWRRMDLAHKTLKAGVLGVCLDRGVCVLRLAKAEVAAPLYNEPYPSPHLCRVQFLDLSMSQIESAALEQLLSMCRYLRKLSLENCSVTATVCRYIGQNKNLEVLNMSMVQGLTENCLVPICNNLQRLDALNVAWTSMSRGALLYLIICLPPGLQKLNLSGCRETLQDEDVQQLCRSCPHLKELDLSDCTLLGVPSVETIANSLRGLEYLALSRCYHVIPNCLPGLRRILTLLAVDVFGMLKESTLKHLRLGMPNIEINKFPFSSIARPTTGIRRTSIWGLRVRD